jgi:predicted acyltransferase
MSVDALRGFDMFWIIGGDALAQALHKVDSTNPLIEGFATQLDHVQWAGFHFYDLIFPLFVFIIGVSITFSIPRRIAESGKVATTWQIFRRALILYILGLIVYGGISKGHEQIRLLGVLQRLALCYFFAGLGFTWLKPKTLAIVCGSLLVGYWAVMTFIPVPGVGAGNFAEGKNLANYIDQQYLPWFKWDGDHDPEGVLSTLPAIASCLLGVFAGLLLQSPMKEGKKVTILLVAGIVSVALGFLWGMQFPVIKKIWTSSFVLVAGGFSSILMGLFYMVIDVWKFRKWAQPFVWIGANAIAIYIAEHLVNPSKLASTMVGGDVAQFFDRHIAAGAGGVVIVLVALGLCIWFVQFLYKHKVFIRV